VCFVTRCIVIVLLCPCKTVLLSRSTMYVKNVIRERNEGVCAHYLRPSLPRRHRDFPWDECWLQPVMLSSRLVRTKLPLDALRRSGTALPHWTQVVPNPLSLMCFRKDQLIRVKNVTTLETCVFFGHIAVSCCAERSLSSVTLGPKRRLRRAFAQAKAGPRAA
jgi:hypothetical protein